MSEEDEGAEKPAPACREGLPGHGHRLFGEAQEDRRREDEGPWDDC